MSTKQGTVSVKWAAVTLGMIVLLIGVSLAALSLRPEKKTVTNFDECIAAGGARMESYPEQCLYEGRTYMNENQSAPAAPLDGTEYVGLTEDEALLRAGRMNVPARVVERDGEGLPTTMDFRYGRHNFYVKDNVVYRVEVEGQAEDMPLPAE